MRIVCSYLVVCQTKADYKFKVKLMIHYGIGLLIWNHEFQQRGSSHIHLAAHYSDIQNHIDEENDSEVQTETADELVYWGPNHQTELQEADPINTQAACIILAWATQ